MHHLHSTSALKLLICVVSRWAAEPADQAAAFDGFARAAEAWQPLEIRVHGARAVLESTPFMHMMYTDESASEHGFWRSA